MSKFSVGEIAILCNSIMLPERNGTECEIIKYYGMGIGAITLTTCEAYQIRFNDGAIDNVSVGILRKRNPPMGDWESLESNIGWERPVEVA